MNRQHHDPSRRVLLTTLSIAALGVLLPISGCQRRTRAPNSAIVGSSPTGVPFSFVDPWSNELTGSMIDTVRSLATQAGISVDLQITPFAALIPSLLARKIDVIAAAMLRTPQRAAVAAFGQQVYAYGGGVVVPMRDSHEYENLASLAALHVGAQAGTRFVDQLSSAGVGRVSTYDNLSDILRDLAHGRVDAAYGDAPILAYQLRIGARPGLKLVSSFKPPEQEALCLVFRPNDPLLERFDLAIEAQRSTQIPAILRRWQLS